MKCTRWYSLWFSLNQLDQDGLNIEICLLITQNYCANNGVETLPIDLKQLGLNVDRCCTDDLS